MAAVQAYACASGKGKKPSRTTNRPAQGLHGRPEAPRHAADQA
jgi:hypothetical protein